MLNDGPLTSFMTRIYFSRVRFVVFPYYLGAAGFEQSGRHSRVLNPFRRNKVLLRSENCISEHNIRKLLAPVHNVGTLHD